MNSSVRQALADVPCMILAGGQSRRFGSKKAIATLHGEPLINILISRLEHQASGPIAINAPSDIGFEVVKHAGITEHLSGAIGPLAGLHAAMVWAKDLGFQTVVTTPVDTPNLPLDFVERLLAAGAPAIGLSEDGSHPVHGLWPTNKASDLANAIKSGMRAAREWVADCQAVHCEFQAETCVDPFYNINTPDDLAYLEKTQSDGRRSV